MLVFLMPLFFLPFSFEAFEFNKQYLLFFLVTISLFAWLAKMILVDKEIRFKRSPLDIFVLAFIFIAILSAIFSVDKGSSVFGLYGRFSDGLIGLLSLGILYFLITNNVSIEKEQETKNLPADRQGKEQKAKNKDASYSVLSVPSIFKVFLRSVFLVVLISYLTLFGVWAKLDGLQFSVGKFQIGLPVVMQQSTFNPVAGSMEGLAVFLAVIVSLLTGLILSGEKKKVIGTLALIFLSLVLLIIIDYTPAWIIIVVSLALFVSVALTKRMFKEDVNKLLLPLLLIILAGVFIFVNTSGLQTLLFKYQLPKEQVLNQSTSFLVGFKAATENIKSGFLGSGIGTWHYDFSKFKPTAFNQSILWQIRFDRAGSEVAEIIGNTGFLGLLSYLILIGMFLMISYIFLQQNRGGLTLFLTFLAVLVGQFVYYQNTILAFVFWLILGLSVVNWQKPVKEKIISLKTFPELSLIFSALLIVFAIMILGGYFFAAKFYLADINYKNALGENRTQKLQTAAGLNPYQSQYKIVLARDYLSKIAAENQKAADQRDQTALTLDVHLAITFAKGGQVGDTYIKGATELSPNRVAAWETAGMIYRDIQGVASGALEWGIKSFEKAITLEPANPVLHTELGKLYLISADKDKARTEYTKAVELKSDYTDAAIQLALMYEGENNLTEAIRQMETLAANYPFDAEVLFQAGRLCFNDNQIDKAISYFEAVVNLMPNHSNGHYSLGVAYQKKGQTSKAVQEFEKVLELNPGNQDVQAKLDQLKK